MASYSGRPLAHCACCLFLVAACSDSTAKDRDAGLVADGPESDIRLDPRDSEVDSAPDTTTADGAACDDGVSAGAAAVGPCSSVAPAQVKLYTDRAAFEAALAQYNVVTFDCVDTSPDSPVSIEANRFEASHGAIITGSAGQYVDEAFDYPSDYVPSSAPNQFAPGPVVAKDGPSGAPETTVTFTADGCVAGFGATFIDADFPGIAGSALEVFSGSGASLARESGFSGDSGSALFRGFLAVDAEGKPVAAISKAQLINGNVWPQQSCCEGVTLDDLVLGRP